jgi:pimeloyl-ACP methyl ester carboxylesterase
MLEVIDKGSSSESHPAPLLFVHGAWHAAWCWDEHFLDFFADKGYRALAVSLRGHGGSPAQKRMQRCSIADFVTDVESVANSLPTRPVVIGHSMGGFVVQKYLETHDAPAGVLVASVSTRGAGGFLLRGMKRHPWHQKHRHNKIAARLQHAQTCTRILLLPTHPRARCRALCSTT